MLHKPYSLVMPDTNRLVIFHYVSSCGKSTRLYHSHHIRYHRYTCICKSSVSETVLLVTIVVLFKLYNIQYDNG